MACSTAASSTPPRRASDSSHSICASTSAISLRRLARVRRVVRLRQLGLSPAPTRSAPHQASTAPHTPARHHRRKRPLQTPHSGSWASPNGLPVHLRHYQPPPTQNPRPKPHGHNAIDTTTPPLCRVGWWCARRRPGAPPRAATAGRRSRRGSGRPRTTPPPPSRCRARRTGAADPTADPLAAVSTSSVRLALPRCWA